MSENHEHNGGASWSVNLVPVPSFEFLHARFTYDRFSGSFKWKIGNCAGKEAGCRQYRSDGTPNAIRVGIQEPGGKLIQYVAHRLIWAFMDGIVPLGMVIDHDDGNPFNNIWKNLKLVTHSKNIAKQKPHNRPRKYPELPRGVFKSYHRFGAKAGVNGDEICFGYYDTPEEAGAAYVAGVKEHHGISL